ncbi:hypothetical protein MINS_32430 [Mycolicibacterium insubricum]|uniref:Serine hydrolase n=1 Tax=Mycolicibacterium insubricum TaxID=444597 RepID=A0A1X0DP01_9MYCO|nr:serine hydrolase domain-containing protein [Mycolicibacterium insubricum]MCV7081712.1 beta-lactamase family protein [Mycolicibacterium insubricum]ORA74144.1 serine hydrolase [Mycolicibacterium insubricum]BBZ67814.1 hypothetical protein MINS_32430 [Mycolicibacterium insubricum]
MSALDAIADWPVPNAAAAVIDVDGRVLAVHGDVNRRFRLASVTKPLVARAVQVAVEEGACDWDTPAGPPGSTLRHLLAHASGLAMLDDAILAPPGIKRIYSNTGFRVAAQTVAERAGIEFGEYLAEAVFAPLGMADSSLPGGAETAGYGGESTVADLSRFAADLLSPVTVSPQMHAEAITVAFPGLGGILPGYGSQRPNDWGLGFELRDGKSPHWTGATNSPSTFGHFGQSGTFIWADPVAELALVVLTDRDFGDWAKPLWPALSDEVLREIGAD